MRLQTGKRDTATGLLIDWPWHPLGAHSPPAWAGLGRCHGDRPSLPLTSLLEHLPDGGREFVGHELGHVGVCAHRGHVRLVGGSRE
jgi:hypothetical protein